MKEIKRLVEMSVGLQRGSKGAVQFIEKLKKIILNLKIQAAYLDNNSQSYSIKVTIDDLNEEIEILKGDVINIEHLGKKLGEEVVKINDQNAMEIVNKIDEISKALWSGSVKTFEFLEKLKITCMNLEIQTMHLGNTAEARAISAIIKILTGEIATLQGSAMMVRESSKEAGRVNRVLEQAFSQPEEDKVKVLK